jgi:hypothetical protein
VYTVKADRLSTAVSGMNTDGKQSAHEAAASNPQRTVVIPSRETHEGYYSMTVALPWTCLHCGGPRGEPFDALSFDGSRRLNVHSWLNPCGHVEKYSEVRRALPTPASTEETARGT